MYLNIPATAVFKLKDLLWISLGHEAIIFAMVNSPRNVAQSEDLEQSLLDSRFDQQVACRAPQPYMWYVWGALQAC